jgi:hypothetical protein
MVIEVSVPANINAAFPVFINSNLKQANSSHEARLKLKMIPKASSFK